MTHTHTYANKYTHMHTNIFALKYAHILTYKPTHVGNTIVFVSLMFAAEWSPRMHGRREPRERNGRADGA